jgi:hypothetical protein
MLPVALSYDKYIAILLKAIPDHIPGRENTDVMPLPAVGQS